VNNFSERLTFLDDNLLKMVDEKEIQFVSGISLSYLKANEQSQLYELLINKQYKINPVIAEELKKLSQSTENIIDIQAELNKLLQPKNTTTQIKIHKKTLTKIKEIIPQDQIENLDSILVNALKLYYEIKE
jgi:ParB family chromosome partitioning protein